MQMRVLLMTSFSGVGFNDAPPMGLYRIKQVFENNGISCDIFDFSLDDLDATLKEAELGTYQVVGMSVSHYHMKEDIEILTKFRKIINRQGGLIIAGGQEATYNYEQWLIAGVDIAFLGYAEPAINDFAKLLQEDVSLCGNRLHHLNGVAYREAGTNIYRPCPPMTPTEFTRLTFDNVLELRIPFEPYWDNARKNSAGLNFWTTVFVPETVRLYTSSHCPNRCGFCSSHRFLAFSQGSFAPIFSLDAENIYRLILRFTQRDGARGFLFSDDEFLVNKERVITLCRKIVEGKQEGHLAEDVRFNCQARVSDFLSASGESRAVNSSLIASMAAAKFHSIGLGVETFCDRLLHCGSMNKKGFTENDSILVIRALLQAGIIPQINIVLFIPEATAAEIKHSIRQGMHFIKQGCQVAVTPLLYSMPGAPIYGNPDFAVRTEKVFLEQANEEMEITLNLIPQDPLLAESCGRIFDIFQDNIEIFRQRYTWPYGKIPKTAAGVLMFAAAGKLLADQALENESWEVLDQITTFSSGDQPAH